jgi:hypothetical protein
MAGVSDKPLNLQGAHSHEILKLFWFSLRHKLNMRRLKYLDLIPDVILQFFH